MQYMQVHRNTPYTHKRTHTYKHTHEVHVYRSGRLYGRNALSIKTEAPYPPATKGVIQLHLHT